MNLLDLDPDELLSTTRAVRRRLDLERPVPLEIVTECLELAQQAPNGNNAQRWHFLVVTDKALQHALVELMRAVRRARSDAPRTGPGGVDYLEQVPMLLIGCIEGRIEGADAAATAAFFGSILPAMWSFCLAARARGLGTRWTTTYLAKEREAAELLGIPYEEVTQVALLPVAYTLGTDFGRAPRRPFEEALHLNRW